MSRREDVPMPRSIYQREAQDSHAFEVGASHDADRENAQLSERIQKNSQFIETDTDSDGIPIRIRYCVLGESSLLPAGEDTRPRVLMIMGLAASLDAWKPQLLDMLTPLPGSNEAPMVMCLLDNRGVGQSSCPRQKSDYSTTAMASDAAAVLDHIGWRSVHLVGFSMGGMIAAKFAATWPARTESLSVVSTSRGNWDSLPRSWRAVKYAFMLSRDNSARMRARLDLKFHFSRPTLASRCAGWGRRQDGLLEEYLQNQGGSGADPPEASARSHSASADDPGSAMLPKEQEQGGGQAGLRGQMSAVWKHKLSRAEKDVLRGAPFPRLCVHGRQDIVAAPSRGAKVAKEVAATLVLLEGAHFLPRERGHEVSLLLEGVILGQPRQAEREHLDPMRHMEPALSSSAPSPSSGELGHKVTTQTQDDSWKNAKSAGGVQMQRVGSAAPA